MEKYHTRKQAGKVLAQHFSAVGEWYQDFAQTTHDEVKSLFKKALINPDQENDQD